jgi:hypothetical protein
MNNLNSIVEWFPKLLNAGLPVPKTEIIRAECNLAQLLYGSVPDGFSEFIALLRMAGDRVGYPCFLRTGYTSGKHRWNETCFVSSRDCFPSHVVALVEFSEMADFLGLPYADWAVREMLPTTPIATLPEYGHMPLVREMRGFITDGKILCRHGYWPPGAIKKGWRKPPENLDSIIADSEVSCAEYTDHVEPLLRRVAEAFTGAWSVDVLETKRGWCVTDCAEAHRSFHWPSCANAPASMRERYDDRNWNG